MHNNILKNKFSKENYIQDVNHFSYENVRYFIYRKKGCKGWLLGNFNLNMRNIDLNTIYLGSAKRKAEEIIENTVKNKISKNPVKKIMKLIRESI